MADHCLRLNHSLLKEMSICCLSPGVEIQRKGPRLRGKIEFGGEIGTHQSRVIQKSNASDDQSLRSSAGSVERCFADLQSRSGQKSIHAISFIDCEARKPKTIMNASFKYTGYAVHYENLLQTDCVAGPVADSV